MGLLEIEALPLLRGIADGSLDPADRTVRDQCARHAATLRRALVDRVAPGLVASLEQVFRAARDRGVLAEVQVIGDPGQVIWADREHDTDVVAALFGEHHLELVVALRLPAGTPLPSLGSRRLARIPRLRPNVKCLIAALRSLPRRPRGLSAIAAGTRKTPTTTPRRCHR